MFLLADVNAGLILKIFGEDQKPPCYAKRDTTTFFKCEFSIVSNGIAINMLEDIPSGVLEFRLYGISSELVTTEPNGKFKVTSYLDQI